MNRINTLPKEQKEERNVLQPLRYDIVVVLTMIVYT